MLVWAIALFALLVVQNHLADCGANHEFVYHVLKMDTTFPGNSTSWRAVESPFLQHAFYCLVIFVAAVITVLCWSGGFQLFRPVAGAARFNKAKGLAIPGLALGILLWFTGFVAQGGEWFLIWQSRDRNGQQAAFCLVVVLGITLLYLVHTGVESDT